MKCVFTVFSVFILCIFVATFSKIGTVSIATPLIEIKFALIEIKFACNRFFYFNIHWKCLLFFFFLNNGFKVYKAV